MGWWNKDDDKTNWPDAIRQRQEAAKLQAQEQAKLYAEAIRMQQTNMNTGLYVSDPSHSHSYPVTCAPGGGGGYQNISAQTNINAQTGAWLWPGTYPQQGLSGLAQDGYPQGILSPAHAMQAVFGTIPQYTGFQSVTAAPKPVPMDPPFSLDELEAAQTFIEALETA